MGIKQIIFDRFDYMKQCAIFTGGEIRNYTNIDISLIQDYFIIAADAGYLHAKKLGLKTNILIGDFDRITSYNVCYTKLLRLIA